MNPYRPEPIVDESKAKRWFWSGLSWGFATGSVLLALVHIFIHWLTHQ